MRSLASVLLLAIGLTGQLAPAKAQGLPPLKLGPHNRVPDCVTAGRLTAFLLSRNPALDRRFADIATHYRRLGDAAGLRWDYAFFQMMVDTASLTFRRGNGEPSAVRPGQNNFAGLGAIGGGVAGESFSDVERGVLAHLQHVQLYAGDRVPAPVAERTRKVQQWGILHTWQRGLAGPVGYGDLALKWAPGDPSYGPSIEALGRRFMEGFCRTGEAAALPVADATARREPAGEPRGRASGLELVRQLLTQAPAESEARRSGLGGASVPPPDERAHAEPARSLPSPLPPRRAPEPETKRVAALPPMPQPDPADEAIKSLVSGRTVLLDTPTGTVIPIAFAPDGTMKGRAGGLAWYLGASTDEGRWWVQRARLCQKWNVWFSRESQCLRLRTSGEVVHWTRDDGKSGTARIAKP